jgi:hypothetical protein
VRKRGNEVSDVSDVSDGTASGYYSFFKKKKKDIQNSCGMGFKLSLETSG